MGRLLRLLAPLAALIIRCGAALPFQPGAVAVIPEDGRSVFLQAFDRARKEIRIEICVLEDPEVLQGLTRALKRGVKVRVIVDQGKYLALRAERENLDTYLTTPGA
jgi:phosphatidylserine/phosphatidylglycerophosphate/cardiolipin synthase-like enzyme